MGIPAHKMTPFEEVFTHIDDVTGVQTTYAVTRLFAFCEAHPDKVQPCSVPVERHHAEYCLTNRGVEPDRLAVLFAHPEYLKKPILFAELPTTDHLLLDGTHRYVCYYKVGMTHIPTYIAPWDVAKDFIIDGIPQMDEAAVMDEPSMLVLLRKLGLLDTPPGQ